MMGILSIIVSNVRLRSTSREFGGAGRISVAKGLNGVGETVCRGRCAKVRACLRAGARTLDNCAEWADSSVLPAGSCMCLVGDSCPGESGSVLNECDGPWCGDWISAIAIVQEVAAGGGSGVRTGGLDRCDRMDRERVSDARLTPYGKGRWDGRVRLALWVCGWGDVAVVGCMVGVRRVVSDTSVCRAEMIWN